ncbi:MAG: hypothetical protein HY329_16780 [Chloroflexi bacterium]|nr:hypothetical protein [Chloroflexota bacterium]
MTKWRRRLGRSAERQLTTDTHSSSQYFIRDPRARIFLVAFAALPLEQQAPRYLAASVLAFAPVFVANVIFSNSFRDTEAADVAFASNLLGIMVGGSLEYLSMLTGHHFLLLPVILCYACALVLHSRSNLLVVAPAGNRRSARFTLDMTGHGKEREVSPQWY